MKNLWDKHISTEKAVMDFTVGDDPEYDRLLAPYDVVASMAHAVMLGETGIIGAGESADLTESLANYFSRVNRDDFRLDDQDEDIHSHLEKYLVNELGETGKKIHTARSRNDQVLVALMLYMRSNIVQLINEIKNLIDIMTNQASRYRNVSLPGYTHLQVAMPSSFGLWLGGYAESLLIDMQVLKGLLMPLDCNPLGSAAGYGTSFPVDREMTARLLGFSRPMYLPTSAQLNRGKFEMLAASGVASAASTLSSFASDSILYMNQNFGFITFPESLTTGSSIMPHKKNPDVLELIRAHCNRIISVPASLAALNGNLTSGYHRDFQLTKELIVPVFSRITSCISMTGIMVDSMEVKTDILEDPEYAYIHSVEEVNARVMQGKSFREAYREVAEEIRRNRYRPGRDASLAHQGGTVDPGTDSISADASELVESITAPPLEALFESVLQHSRTKRMNKPE